MINLIHPSRGRAKKAVETAKKWIESAQCEVFHMFSLDHDDEQLNQYTKNAPGSYIVSCNSNVVEATNAGAASSKGYVLVYLSDDFECFPGWGLVIRALARKYRDTEWILKTDDRLQKFDNPLITMPIMSRKLYENLGYMWHPDYKNQFVDNDLFRVCQQRNAIKFHPEIKFRHKHPDVSDTPWDDTYQRGSSKEAHDVGQRIFLNRMMKGFN